MVHISLSILLIAICIFAVTGEYPCKTPADIVLVIDASTSGMTSHEFQDQLVFAQILLEHFNVSLKTVRFGVVSFGSDSKAVVPFRKIYDTKSKVQDKIIEIVQDKNRHGTAKTNLGAGIQRAKDELDEFGRAGVAKIIVILMEGASQYYEAAVEQAKDAMQRNITITFVNIHRNTQNLKKHAEIASPPKEQYLIPVKSTKDFFVIHRPFAQRICEAVEEFNMNSAHTSK